MLAGLRSLHRFFIDFLSAYGLLEVATSEPKHWYCSLVYLCCVFSNCWRGDLLLLVRLLSLVDVDDHFAR